MTNEEAIKELQSMCDHLHAHGICDKDSNMLTACKMAISALEQNESAEEWYKLFVEKLDEQEPCKNCGYAEGSPFCLKYCPHDAERKKEQEPCDDAISRQAVLDLINDQKDAFYSEGDKCLFESYVNELPSITPRQKYGKWIENASEYQNIDPPYICSECGNMHLRKTDYCDQCGCRMVEPQGRGNKE